MLNGVTVLRGKAVDAAGRDVPLTAVPYYAWGNRESGPMTVWIDEKRRRGQATGKKR